jgi:hypothetical protein
MDPTDFCTIERSGPTLSDGAMKEVQLNRFFWIFMPNDSKRHRDIDPNVEFLEQFALQTLLQRFSLFPFPAREFPEAGKVDPCPTLGNEIAAVFNNQAGSYFD